MPPPPYIYSKLDIKTQDIRLITLLPGTFNDAIRLSISHKPFDIPMEQERHPVAKVVSLEEVQKTLPDNWTAFETLEGRIYYDYADPITGLGPTSWTHPNLQLDPTGGGSGSGGSRDNDITGFHANFEALSYTWGSAENPEVVYVESFHQRTHTEVSSTTSPSTLKIGRNLACALRHLRYVDTVRVLWIDAICINQQDLEERATQVVRMGNIYKFARRVVVWLGPRSANSGLAISTLAFLGKQVEVNKIYGRSAAPDCTQPLWYTASYALPYTEEVWEAIHDLLELPWFKRLWISQEIQLANPDSIMMCGNDEISWYLFRRSIKCLYARQKGVPRKLSTLLPNIDRLSMYLIGTRLQRLLAVSRERKCAEPSDKVYAIQGLVPPVIASKIRPNYSISPADVYKSTFLEHVSLVHRLEFLAACNIQGQKTVGLPSWVPDWSGDIPEEVGFFTDSYCTGYSSSQTKFLPPDILKVTGVKCLTISTVGEYLLNSDDDILNVIQGLGTERLTKESYVTGQSLLDACAWTMSRGQLRDRFHKVTIDPSVEEMKKFILNKA